MISRSEIQNVWWLQTWSNKIKQTIIKERSPKQNHAPLISSGINAFSPTHTNALFNCRDKKKSIRRFSETHNFNFHTRISLLSKLLNIFRSFRRSNNELILVIRNAYFRYTSREEKSLNTSGLKFWVDVIIIDAGIMVTTVNENK